MPAVSLPKMSQSPSVNFVCQSGRLPLVEKSQIGRRHRVGEIEECGGIIVNGQAEARPIVHGAAAEISVAENEAQGTDEMKFGSAGDAGAGDVAGVGGDLWLEQGHLEAMRAKVKADQMLSMSRPWRST